jgi:hypothetical protein
VAHDPRYVFEGIHKQQLFDVAFSAIPACRSVHSASTLPAFAIDEELGEVPFDRLTAQQPRASLS